MNPATNHIAIFQEANIRRTLHEGAWWFAIVDVVAVLTDSTDVSQYIKKCVSETNRSIATGVQFVPPSHASQ